MKQKRSPSPALWPSFLLVILILIVTLVGRLSWWWNIVNLRLTEIRPPIEDLFTFFPAALALCGLVVLCACLIVWCLSRYRRQGLIPSAILVVGLCIVFQLPMPPDPPTEEMTHFLAYRADYEAVVEMARQNTLTEPCPYSPMEGRYAPPAGFEHVSKERCLEVGYTGLVRTLASVEFAAFDGVYHTLFYVENDDGDPCPGYLEMNVEQKIEPHWYVCEFIGDDEWPG